MMMQNWETGIVLLMLPVIISVCDAQMSKPCDPPSQLTFRAVAYDHEYTTFNRYRGSYDAVSKRLAFYEETTSVAPGKQYFHFIYIFGEGVAYEINLTTKKCVKAPSGLFRGWGIPVNATFEGDLILGGPNDGLEVMQWSDKIPMKRATWVGTYSRRECYPLTTIVFDTADARRSSTYNLYDIVQGLANPDDFLPPPQCSSVPATRHLTRLAALFPRMRALDEM